MPGGEADAPPRALVESPLRFRADIQGLRALAVAGVLAFHAGVPHAAGGYVGVDVFYVISGFLITGLMLRDASRDGTVRFAEFYARRARRILPAATLVIVATLALALFVRTPVENGRSAEDARASALFYENNRLADRSVDYFAEDDAPSAFQQYWSLSLEEQFYVVWPVAFAALAGSFRRGRPLRRGRLAFGLSLLTLASFALSVAWVGNRPAAAFFLLPARAWELGIGALLAVSAARLAQLSPRTRTVLSHAGAAAIAAAITLFTLGTPFPGWAALLPTLGTAAVIAAGSGGVRGGGVVDRVLSSRLMQAGGRYSFALYLWHWPILVVRPEILDPIYATWPRRTMFMLLATTAAAVVTYHVVENPARRSASLRASARKSLAMGAGLVAGSVLLIAVFAANVGPLSTEKIAASRPAAPAPVAATEFVPKNLSPPLADAESHDYVRCDDPCTFGDTTGPVRVVLFGDSHAEHLATGFAAAGRRLGARIELITLGACPSYLIAPKTSSRACNEFRARAFDRLRDQPPDVIVLSNRSAEALRSSPQRWEQGVRATIDRLPRASRVMVVTETPIAAQAVASCLSEHLDDARACDVAWPEDANARLMRVARDAGAQVLDLRPVLCSAERCPAISGHRLLYGDRHHLTVEFSASLGPWIATILRPHVG